MTITDNYRPTKKALKGVKQSFSGKDVYFTLDCPLPRDEEHGRYVLVYEVISLNKEESFKKVFYADSIYEMSNKKSPEYNYSTSFYNSWVFRELVKRAFKQKLILEWKGLTSLAEGTDHFIPLLNPKLLKSFVHIKDGTEYVTFLYSSDTETNRFKVYAFESIIKKNNNIQTQDETSGGSYGSLEGLIPFLGNTNPITLFAIPSELDAIAYIKSLNPKT